MSAAASVESTEDGVEEGNGRENDGGRGGRGLISYGEASYWDARYMEEGCAHYDWYQRYDALRPFIRRFIPTSSRLLMIGCGSSLMSEDMLTDGYADIINIDISSVVIDSMKNKYANVPEMKYIQMDVRDMCFFSDESFDCAIDKGTLDSLMCGIDAPLSTSRMVLEVNRLLRPGGVFMLITYGDPSVRVPHLKQVECNWEIILYIIPRPGFEGQNARSGSSSGNSSKRSFLDPVPLTEDGRLPFGFVPEDPDSHYIYVCIKTHGVSGAGDAALAGIADRTEE